MKIRRPWTTKHWCASVIEPEWPFAYSKYEHQIEESKGRVSSNKQDVRHKCQTQGVQSKCHICENIQCGENDDDVWTTKKNSTSTNSNSAWKMCHFQLQGVQWDEMSKNIPTVTDVPFAVGGTHRYDYGGENTTHVCMYMSGKKPCQSHSGRDYSSCVVRCWGYLPGQLSGRNNTVGPTSRVVKLHGNGVEGGDKDFDDDDDDDDDQSDDDQSDDVGIWPNLKLALKQNGLNSTPWLLPQPTATWSYPKSDLVGNNITYNIGPTLELLPQGFTFTLAGSIDGQEGFQDGKGPEARFRFPEGVAVNHEGYVFVADTGNHAIRMITPSGRVTTIAGNGQPGFTDGSTSGNAQFSSPSGITIWQDPSRRDGNLVLFVADTGNNRIRKIYGFMVSDEESKEKMFVNATVECLCGNCGKSPQVGFADGNGNLSRFDNPIGITIGGSGRIFVTDTNNHLIRMIDQSGKVRTLAGKLRTAELNKDGERLEGCPDPCLTGSQGYEDGKLSEAKFSFPLGIALSPEESYLLVTSRHYLRKIDLEKKMVMTANGNNRENEVDGQGREASFNKPHGVTMTNDEYAFIVDSASCRIRRAATPKLFAVKLKCTDSLVKVFRPSGCFSYDAKTDQHGLMATSRAGYIQYNHKYQNWTNKDLGKDYIGRSLKNCVGAPPLDTMDRKSWDDDSLVLDDGKIAVREDPNEGSLVQVACPNSCNSTNNLQIYGSRVQRENRLISLYTSESPICIAAIHAGLINSSTSETYLDLTLHRSINTNIKNTSSFTYTVSSGVEENIDTTHETHGFYSLQLSTMDLVIQTISGSPSSKRADFCGFQDSVPAQDAEFNIPTSISAFVNGTLNDKSNFLYVTDRNNHVVRAVSATCSLVCENGSRCVGTDKCLCLPGWEGVDCSIPICTEECNERQICIGPNQCGCIPGFRGSTCSEATCAQKCENSGLCIAPDTCSCSPGWFDANCTTPVCSQTCGNGGNCTAPNQCSCPKDWTGIDCRQPVCEQQCLNGGICIAPNTCACPPSWSGFNCSEPICHQGYFQPYNTNSLNRQESSWMEYVPCNVTEWCNTTNNFDCSQHLRNYTLTLPLYGSEWRFKTGLADRPSRCFMIELMVDAKSPFQYIKSSNNEPTTHQRYTNITPNDWFSEIPQPWNARILPNRNYTKPWTYLRDRQVALVETRYVTQGSYKCANNGDCIAPDTCACSNGWMGFDCRVPICEQGYYEADQQHFVQGINDAKELEKFQPFLHPSHVYFIATDDEEYSNPYFTMVQENFLNHSFVERISLKAGGKRYLQINGNGQGGYECSIRSVTEWEDYRSGTIFEHPNYYSRYMDRKKAEGDGKHYSHWEEMGWDPLHQKTNIFQLNTKAIGVDEIERDQLFVYTDKGYKKDGYWFRTNFSWTKGYCIIEFERKCDDPMKERDLEASTLGKTSNIVQDTDLSFRPRIYYDDDRVEMLGEWRVEGGECTDQVIRGCFNNGTCVGPNKCKCATGWTGYDCKLPICHQRCKHNGNCTLPNTCTCEKGWTGIDCSIPICAQNCNNGGKCVAPDTCKCAQWENTWRDGRFHGGVPLYQTPNGDPQMTGWTGYDCSTPICTQAERFIHNVNTNSYKWSELIPLGGHGKDGKLRCDKVKCPEFDEMVTMNDGESFQSGCGFDPIATGCCFEIETDTDSKEYLCFKCDPTYMKITSDTISCPVEGIKKYYFKTIFEVTKEFFKDKRSNKVKVCGPNHDPMPIEGANLTSQGFLCERYEWEQGDYVDDAGLNKESAIGGSDGLLSGRHVRVNYHNYIRDKNDKYNWSEKDSVPGEGIFACYNEGSCIEPDVCTCRDGYTGFDCKIPLCRHQQMDGTVVGCLNHGQCVKKDACKCKREQSVLWMQYEGANRGLTGWTGSDCSMPICSQGYFDPDCTDNHFAVGGEGCFRCHNDGLCIAPDVCQCADGWTGFNCKTPVCRLTATPLIKRQLMTVDENKIKLFENDPCGMKDFHDGNLFKSTENRGFCALPNQCSCHCKSIHDAELCKAFGGQHCNLPFQDRLHHFRNVLAPNEIFGTRSCYSGYEGAVDENDKFVSCHLNIYEPTYLVDKSISLIFWGTFLFLSTVITFIHYRIKLKRRNLEAKIEERRLRRGAVKPSDLHAFSSSFHDPRTNKED